MPDIYAELLPLINDHRWNQSIDTYFYYAYDPHDPDETEKVIQKFALSHGFELYNMTARLDKIRTMVDLVKLYSTCVKLAISKPKTLFFMVPNLEFSNSLSVVEGLFTLRKSLVSGSLNVFFKDKREATTNEKKCMRGGRYDLVLFQDDNIVTLSNNTMLEIHRQLECLVAECPICFELLSDINYGAINYPFACGHAFHHQCVAMCTVCPTCRTIHKAKRVVNFEMKRTDVSPR
jgi:hypothetical protein